MKWDFWSFTIGEFVGMFSLAICLLHKIKKGDKNDK